MDISIKLSRDFERCLDDLRKKYGEDFEFLNGIHPSQLDHSCFLDNFVKNDTLADTTVDPNANANHKDIRSFIIEKGKSEDKLFGLNKVFYEMKKKWGLKTAKDWLEQEFSRGFYLNDATSVSYFPYCYAVDLTRLAKEGLFFLKGYNNQPPKHLTTFLDAVIEFVSFLSNRQSGSVGLPNILIWCYYFWKKDVEEGYYMKSPEYYRDQNFQEIIFKLNQPYLRQGTQSAFTNFSIFDRNYFEALFGGKTFPDGSYMIDIEDEFMEYQKAFMRMVSKTRSENMFTFPVLTFSLLRKDGKFVDEDFAKWCCLHNMQWGDSNFFVSDDITSLSNCCRLVSDVKDLGYFNSVGGTALEVGSIKVNTINLARIAYETKTKAQYLNMLKDMLLSLRTENPDMAIVLGSTFGDKPSLLVVLGQARVDAGKNASNIVRQAGKEMQGGGGGQPFFATAGGKNVGGVAKAMEVAKSIIEE